MNITDINPLFPGTCHLRFFYRGQDIFWVFYFLVVVGSVFGMTLCACSDEHHCQLCKCTWGWQYYGEDEFVVVPEDEQGIQNVWDPEERTMVEEKNYFDVDYGTHKVSLQHHKLARKPSPKF